MRCLQLAMFVLLSFGSCYVLGDMDEEITIAAKKVFFDVYYNSESGRIAVQLEPRGLLPDEVVSVAIEVADTIAVCIVNGLEKDSSPVAKSYLMLITDGTPLDEVNGFLDSAYSKAELKDFTGLTIQLMIDCKKSAYAVQHLSPA